MAYTRTLGVPSSCGHGDDIAVTFQEWGRWRETLRAMGARLRSDAG